MLRDIIRVARRLARRVLPDRVRIRLWKGLRSGQVSGARILDRLAGAAPRAVGSSLSKWAMRLRITSRSRLVPEEELERSMRAALSVLSSRGAAHGDYLEFGVYNGTSMVCMHRALEKEGIRGVRMFGFDSFQGLPESASRADEGGVWGTGDFSASKEFALAVLRHGGVDLGTVQLVEGWYDQTLTPDTAKALGIGAVSMVMVDCDLYSSTQTALAFCGPLLADVAVVIFDDWHAGGLGERGLGERRAFEEFLEAHPELTAERLEGLAYNENAEIFLVERSSGA